MSYAEDKLSAGMRCIKYLIVAFNTIFVITGILLIAVGTTTHDLYYQVDEFLEGKFFSPGTLLIFVGSAIFVIAFFGCFGALRESTFMINVFAVMLGLVFVLEASAGIAAFVYKDDIRDTVRGRMYDALDLYESNSEINSTIDLIQEELVCCGVEGPEDWKDKIHDGLMFNQSQYIVLPNSCCKEYQPRGGDYQLPAACLLINKRGCLEGLADTIRSSVILLSGSAFIVSIIQVIGMYFAFSLARALKTAKRERARLHYDKQRRLEHAYSMFGSSQEKPPPPPYSSTDHIKQTKT